MSTGCNAKEIKLKFCIAVFGFSSGVEEVSEEKNPF